MNLNIFNINFSKLKFSFGKKKGHSQIETKNDIVKLLNQDINYLLDLKNTKILMVLHPSMKIKLYHNLDNEDTDLFYNKSLIDEQEFSSISILYEKIMNDMVNHHKLELHKNININNNLYKLQFISYKDINDKIFAFLVLKTPYTKITDVVI